MPDTFADSNGDTQPMDTIAQATVRVASPDTVTMHRPEDHVEHVEVQVRAADVDEWQRAGWAVKAADE